MPSVSVLVTDLFINNAVRFTPPTVPYVKRYGFGRSAIAKGPW